MYLGSEGACFFIKSRPLNNYAAGSLQLGLFGEGVVA